MRFLQSLWFPLCLGIITLVAILSAIFKTTPGTYIKAVHEPYKEGEWWQPPSEDDIPHDSEGDLIRYGKELIVNTSKYLGPKGLVLQVSNNMNCQNCHIAAGTQNFANPFSSVSSTYPKHRDRSGKLESVEFRVNECLQRSMNGSEIDSNSLEMRAMVAYLKWVGKDIPKGLKPKGTAVEIPPFLDRPADPQKGKLVYEKACQRCHGANGEGFLADSASYTYPPLWGENSFNVSAGMYQLSRMAGFIKNNMPFGVTWENPSLSNEEAWDVAAFIAAQHRPQKTFTYDWPDISKKPVDYTFCPYADSF
jgi:thiosulfate dehydrogenase